MSAWQLVGVGAAALALVFGALWLVERRTSNATLVDVGWAASLGLLALLAASGSAQGWGPRRSALALAAGLWSTRLALHLYARHRGRAEDGRYQALRARWGARAHVYFAGFYALQGALALALAAPFFLAARNAEPRFGALELAGFALLALGVLGETLADRQLQRHRADPRLRGRVCRSGLWAWSRHPNYFCEWLCWLAFALIALDAPHGFYALACPLAMLVLVTRVSGIPPTEAQALRSRGDEYRAYQRSTSAFFPWPPRRADALAGEPRA